MKIAVVQVRDTMSDVQVQQGDPMIVVTRLVRPLAGPMAVVAVVMIDGIVVVQRVVIVITAVRRVSSSADLGVNDMMKTAR